MSDYSRFGADTPTILVTIYAIKGSAPREPGAFMLVTDHDVQGTIGGGQAEWLVIEQARRLLKQGIDQQEIDLPLGPEIGQCCGGRMILTLERLTPERQKALAQRVMMEEEARPHIAIFGAGHVGLALAQALMPLPFHTHLYDSRAGERPEGLAQTIHFHRTALPEAEVKHIAKGGACVIMTHDHGLDFLIAAEALARPDFRYIGMIGSKTKRARFAGWLSDEGKVHADLSRLTLPIGASNVQDKRPAVIAAMVAAELITALLG